MLDLQRKRKVIFDYIWAIWLYRLCKLLVTMECNILPIAQELSLIFCLFSDSKETKENSPCCGLRRVFEKKKRPQLCPRYPKAVNYNHDYNENTEIKKLFI